MEIDAEQVSAYHLKKGGPAALFQASSCKVSYYYMRQILEALPQLPVINQADANRWVEGITRYHAPRAAWHAKRLHGIGGSEMGALVSFYRGESSTGFSDAKEIVEGKLMKRLPQFETFHMRRGNALEDLARQAYLKSSSGVVDHQATAALRAAKSIPGYEFMVGNPDEIVLVNGKRYVVDYKVPNTFSDAVEFDYEVQLHHYATLAKLAGVRIDGLVLAKLDIPPQMSEYLTKNINGFEPHQVAQLVDSIVNVNLPGCRIVPITVDLQRPLQAELLAAGRDCWNDYVLKGEIPQLRSKQELDLEGKVKLDLARYQQQYLMAKSGISYLESVVKGSQAGMTKILEGVNYDGKQFPLDAVRVSPNKLDSDRVVSEALLRGASEGDLRSSTRSYTVATLLKEIQTLGGDIDAEHLYDLPMDDKKAQAYLKDIGVDLANLRQPGISVRLAGTTESNAAKKHYEETAAERFRPWINESLISNQDEESHYRDNDPDEAPLMPIEPETGQFDGALADAFKAFESQDEQRPQNPMRASLGLC